MRRFGYVQLKETLEQTEDTVKTLLLLMLRLLPSDPGLDEWMLRTFKRFIVSIIIQIRHFVSGVDGTESCKLPDSHICPKTTLCSLQLRKTKVKFPFAVFCK